MATGLRDLDDEERPWGLDCYCLTMCLWNSRAAHREKSLLNGASPFPVYKREFELLDTLSFS